jgi:nicotinamidase-related amidase
LSISRHAGSGQHGQLATVVEAADRDYRLYVLSDGTEDPGEQTRDVLLGQVFPRRAHVIDTATLRGLLSP